MSHDKTISINKDINRGEIKARKGSDIEQAICDDFKGVLDQTKEYTTAELIDTFKDSPEWKWDALIEFIFLRADWRGKDSEKEAKMLNVLNDFIKIFHVGGGGDNDDDPSVITGFDEENHREFVENFDDASEDQKKILTNALADMARDI